MNYAFAVLAAAFALNGLAFLAFWLDKTAARNGGRRIPEKTLLALALLGGCLGALLGQRMLRHKTMKEPFRTRLRVIVLAEAAAIVMAAGYVIVIWNARNG